MPILRKFNPNTAHYYTVNQLLEPPILQKYFCFVGLKLGAEVLGVEVSSALSLGVIVATLGGGVGLSLLAAEEEKAAYDPGSAQSMAIKMINKVVGGDDNKQGD